MQLLTTLLVSGTVIRVAQLFAALSILILLHEFGHFFFARLFKTRVEKFYLFFDFLFPFPNLLNFSLFKKKKGDTEYGLGWFPLGGYVKISGMVDESMDKEQLDLPPQPWEFRSKPAWQRLFIMLGGIIVNVLLAIVIYALILFVFGEKKLPIAEMNDGVIMADSLGYELGFKDGDKIVSVNNEPLTYFDEIMSHMLEAKTVEVIRDGKPLQLDMPVDFTGKYVDKQTSHLFMPSFPTVVGEVLPNSNAKKAGLKAKDHIIGINGIPVTYFRQFKGSIDTMKGQKVLLSVIRDDKEITIPAQVNDSGKLGFATGDLTSEDMERMHLYKFEVRKYSFLQSIPAGARTSWNVVSKYAKSLKLLFKPATGAYKGVGGFASMTKIFPDYWDWEIFWQATAFISIVLAFMNLLPIPGLDGGYVLFLLFEIVSGRKVSENVMEKATAVGLVLLLLLMVFANGMDVFRWVKG